MSDLDFIVDSYKVMSVLTGYRYIKGVFCEDEGIELMFVNEGDYFIYTFYYDDQVENTIRVGGVHCDMPMRRFQQISKFVNIMHMYRKDIKEIKDFVDYLEKEKENENID